MNLAKRTVRLCWSLTAVWLLWAGTAWAAGQPLGDLQYTPTQIAPINIGGVLLQLVLSLAVVIGLALILVKFLQKNNLLARQSAWARIVDQVSVGPNKMLVLAEIFGKVYVLGVTEHSITTLLGENDIDLSQVKQAFAEAENRKRLVPAIPWQSVSGHSGFQDRRPEKALRAQAEGRFTQVRITRKAALVIACFVLVELAGCFLLAGRRLGAAPGLRRYRPIHSHTAREP